MVGGGGAPTPPAQVKRVGKAFKNAQPGQGYGLTETNGGICTNGGPAYLARPTSCGRPFPIVDVCVVDEETGAVRLRLEGPEGHLKHSTIQHRVKTQPSETGCGPQAGGCFTLPLEDRPAPAYRSWLPSCPS